MSKEYIRSQVDPKDHAGVGKDSPVQRPRSGWKSQKKGGLRMFK
jgi:hypothetical protein